MSDQTRSWLHTLTDIIHTPITSHQLPFSSSQSKSTVYCRSTQRSVLNWLMDKIFHRVFLEFPSLKTFHRQIFKPRRKLKMGSCNSSRSSLSSPQVNVLLPLLTVTTAVPVYCQFTIFQTGRSFKLCFLQFLPSNVNKVLDQKKQINATPLVTTSSMVDAVSAAMKPIVANITNPARNAVHASNNDIITASLQQEIYMLNIG